MNGSCSHGRVLVEIGPGRGDFLFHLAASNPDALVCGVEIKRKRFLKLLERRDRLGVGNVSLILGDARDVLAKLDHPADAIYILFPDPWPKRRHAWHRLLDPESVATFADRLKSGGELRFVTDHRAYAKSVASTIATDSRYINACPEPIVTDCPESYPTFFAQKWRAEGRTIYYQRYRIGDLTAE